MNLTNVTLLQNISLDILKVIVVDEADLVLSYGYEDDLRTIIKYIPKICQAFLMSATLSPVSTI
jgi:superfamily II DNA/RNA helicase